MRVELSKYEEQYVLGKGWITDWKYPNEETLRATISNPIIKKPDKNLLFEEQELLSKEDHINLFLPFPKNYIKALPYKRYDQVTFAGIIKSYTRKDGSNDWGVFPIAQSMLHMEFFEMTEYVSNILDNYDNGAVEILIHLEKNVKPYILHLEEELDEAGDLLPTFYHNYQYYKRQIDAWKVDITHMCKIIRTIHSNRRLRRKCKISKNIARHIPAFDFDNPSVAQMGKLQKRINKKYHFKGE